MKDIMKCTCPMVQQGLIKNPEHCECSRQSILYILSQLEPKSKYDVQIIDTILKGAERCTFRITKKLTYCSVHSSQISAVYPKYLAVSTIMRTFANKFARTSSASAIRASSIALGLHRPCSRKPIRQ